MEIFSTHNSIDLIIIFLGTISFTYYLFLSQLKLQKLNKNLKYQSTELNSIIKSANCGIMHIDANKTIKHLNPIFCSFFSLPQENFKTLQDYLNILDEEQQRIFLKHLDAKVDATFEQSFFDKEGKEINLNIFLSFFDATKDTVVIATSREDKLALQKALQKSQIFFNHSDLGHIILDNDLNILEINQSFCKLMGYEPSELILKNFDILFKTQLLYQTFLKNYLRNNSLSEISNVEYRLKRKDDTMVWVEIFGRKFKDGSKNYFIWSIRDITVRVNSRNTIRNLNSKLQKEFDRLAEILDVIPMPVFIKNQNFNYIECNDAFCTFLSLKKSEIIDRNVFELFTEEEASDFHQKDKEMIYEKYQLYQKKLQSGQVVEIHKKTLFDEQDDFNGFVGVVIDITEEVNEKNYLSKRVKEELEKNKKEREVRQEEQLQNMKFSTIGKMAAGITHEINTPLTYIKGNFEMLHEDIYALDKGFLRDRMLEDANSIKSGLERVGKIIETMREVSQKHSEKKEFINIYDTLVSSLIISHNKSKQVVNINLNGIKFDLDFDASQLDSCSVFVQKQRIEQVWIIIINNALDELVKTVDFNQREFNIDVKCQTNTLRVLFSDNGGGIQDSILDEVFEPFESTKESSGIGIGLNIAKKIIEDQNGTIQAYNGNKGAVFEITLPIKEAIDAL